MAGNPRHIIRDPKIDNNYLSYINNLSTGNNTTNVTSSKDSIKQYVKTKNGIFNGAFGSVGQVLAISGGTLDLTANSTGAVVVRRMIYVMPESGTSDTIDNIEINGLELPYQELTLMSSTGNTITIAHNSSGGGTTKNIYCPGDTDYVLAPNEAVKLIYDSINTIWLVTGLGASASSWVGTATSSLDMSDYDITKIDRLNFSTTGTDNLATTDYGIGTDSTDSNDLHYNVPSGRSHEFDIGGVQALNISPTTLTSQINLWVAGSITATGNVTFRGTVDLGNSSSDVITVTGTPTFATAVSFNNDSTLGTFGGGHEVNLNAKLDFRDHTNATNQTASDSDGYIEILVGGLAKKLYYY